MFLPMSQPKLPCHTSPVLGIEGSIGPIMSKLCIVVGGIRDKSLIVCFIDGAV